MVDNINKLPHNFQELEIINMKKHPELNESWVQSIIANKPDILGLGNNLELVRKEKVQTSGGRVDIILGDDDSKYCVEVQLGKTDESHIIRCIEYWDNERKRYKDVDYTAVLIAEDITSRFFNIISLFNGAIPIIAIQMKCVKLPDNKYGLVFSKILDKVEQEIPTDEETIVDRKYWEDRSNSKVMGMLDTLVKSLNDADGNKDIYELSYLKHYVGIKKNSIADNAVHFNPRKHDNARMHIRISQSTEIDNELAKTDIEVLRSDSKYYLLRITPSNIKSEKDMDFIKEQMLAAYNG